MGYQDSITLTGMLCLLELEGNFWGIEEGEEEGEEEDEGFF
jgi:hypothetical protein